MTDERIKNTTKQHPKFLCEKKTYCSPGLTVQGASTCCAGNLDSLRREPRLAVQGTSNNSAGNLDLLRREPQLAV